MTDHQHELHGDADGRQSARGPESQHRYLTGLGESGWTIAVIVGFCSVLCLSAIGSRFGPAITPDSVQYLSAAEAFSAGDGLRSTDGSSFVWWAPGYPIVLAGVAKMFSTDPVDAAEKLNLLLSFLSCLLAWIVLRRVSGFDWRGVFGLVVFGLGISTLVIGGKMLSESLFVLLVLLLIVLLGDKRTWANVVIASVVAALLFLVRYAGVAFVGAGFLAIALAGPRSRSHYAKAVFFLLAGTAPGALWMINNRFLAGSFTGTRRFSMVDPLSSVVGFLEGISELFLLPVLPGWAGVVAGLVLLTLLLAGSKVFSPNDSASSDSVKLGSLRVSVIFVWTYLVFLLATSTLKLSSVVDNRLLIPVLLPVVAILVNAVQQRWVSVGRFGRSQPPIVASPTILSVYKRKLSSLGTPIVLVFFVASLCLSIVYVMMRSDVGSGGLNTTAWRSSPTVAALAQTPSVGPMWSNKPEAIRYFRGLPSRDYLEAHDGFRPGDSFVWFAFEERNAALYNDWLRDRLSWLLRSTDIGSPGSDSQTMAISECNSVAKELTQDQYEMLNQTADGCIFLVTERVIE